jgi:hypothetical protein
LYLCNKAWAISVRTCFYVFMPPIFILKMVHATQIVFKFWVPVLWIPCFWNLNQFWSMSTKPERYVLTCLEASTFFQHKLI